MVEKTIKTFPMVPANIVGIPIAHEIIMIKKRITRRPVVYEMTIQISKSFSGNQTVSCFEISNRIRREAQIIVR